MGLSAGLATAGIVVYHSHTPQNMIKEVIEKEFTKTFNYKVTIGSLSGSLVTGVTLHDIRFSDNPHFPKETVITIEQAKVFYNPIKAIQKKGDFAAAAYRIEVENVHVRAWRTKEDMWTILELIPKPPKDPKVQAPPPYFCWKDLY